MTDNGPAQEIIVVSIADDNYAQHLGVTFASVLMNVSPGANVRLFVISTGLTEENQAKLIGTVEKFGAHIQFAAIDSSPYQGFDSMGNNSRETYLRLAIADVIPTSMSKCICLDSDVVVTGNIAELWETDLQGRAIAAVPDTWAASQCQTLGIPEGVYFNAGIMIADLNKWRAESINLRAMEYIGLNTQLLKYHEQDALNALLYEDWVPLPSTWNAHSTIIKNWKSSQLPAAIHFTGLSKPWHFDNIHPYKQEYYRYLEMTEWKNYKPQVNTIRMIKRATRPMMPVLEKILPRPAFSLLQKFKSQLLN
ncbi:glycosyltransferase family 8 protein [Cohnella endophytica]|uniref:Glycosyltransferase family 8 protein n=1 Tax=Cohnella endophytica TaxID=2419778 RepID=A0A494XYK4_9BACL|nr:glycosyltransferase family 8 protein [Cohnella endophytica]RKP53194.1 glycosyltransferase family 8 protein [Cohnella endophytica]